MTDDIRIFPDHSYSLTQTSPLLPAIGSLHRVYPYGLCAPSRTIPQRRGGHPIQACSQAGPCHKPRQAVISFCGVSMNLRPQRKWRTWSCEHGAFVKVCGFVSGCLSLIARFWSRPMFRRRVPTRCPMTRQIACGTLKRRQHILHILINSSEALVCVRVRNKPYRRVESQSICSKKATLVAHLIVSA
jgi:hypothetical protein